MSGQHSMIPPSAAHIWRYCPGWVTLARDNPQQDTEHTLRGEAIHEIGAILINAYLHGDPNPEVPIGHVAGNGTVATEDMIECADLWANVFLDGYKDRVVKGGLQYGVEQPVKCPSIHAYNYGTPDSWLYDPNDRLFILDDCKGGHVHVDPFENWQLIDYASGVCDTLELKRPDTKVWFRIIQPFSYHHDGPVRYWKTTLSTLQRQYWPELARAAELAMSMDARLATGHQCRRCHVRACCPAALRCGMELYETAMFPITRKLSPESLGVQMSIIDRAMEQLKGLKTGCEEQVKATIKGGTAVPGWCLQPTADREKWNRSIDEILALGSLLGVDLSAPGTITPNQARKKGVPNELLATYAGRETGLELKPESTDWVRMIFQQTGE